MLGKKILFVLISLVIIITYIFSFCFFHPQTKKFVQGLFQRARTYGLVQKDIYQNKVILNLLPQDFSESYLVSSFKPTYLERLPSFNFIYKKFSPDIGKVLIFTQSNSMESRLGAIFELASPYEQNWEKFTKVIKYFWAIKFPTQRAITLPDNTKAQELIADENSVQSEKINYQGLEIQLLKKQTATIVFARINEYAFLSDSQKLIEDIISSTQKLDTKKYVKCLSEANKLILIDKSQYENKQRSIENFPLAIFLGSDFGKIKNCI